MRLQNDLHLLNQRIALLIETLRSDVFSVCYLVGFETILKDGLACSDQLMSVTGKI